MDGSSSKPVVCEPKLDCLRCPRHSARLPHAARLRCRALPHRGQRVGKEQLRAIECLLGTVKAIGPTRGPHRRARSGRLRRARSVCRRE